MHVGAGYVWAVYCIEVYRETGSPPLGLSLGLPPPDAADACPPRPPTHTRPITYPPSRPFVPSAPSAPSAPTAPSINPPTLQELLRLNVFKGATSVLGAKEFIGRCKFAVAEAAEVGGCVGGGVVGGWAGPGSSSFAESTDEAVVLPAARRGRVAEAAEVGGWALAAVLLSVLLAAGAAAGTSTSAPCLQLRDTPHRVHLLCALRPRCARCAEPLAAGGQVDAPGARRVRKRGWMCEPPQLPA
jgi:hypothetical protein